MPNKIFCFALLLWTVQGCRPSPNAENTSAAIPLFPGDHVGYSAVGTEALYKIDLEEGEFVRLEVSQENLDLEVELISPSGEKLLFDLPTYQDFSERICWIASESGDYVVRVSPFGSAKGRFWLRLSNPRPAKAIDQRCAQAMSLFALAESQRSRKQSSEELAANYEEAGRQWDAAGEDYLAALAFRQAGSQRHRLGQAVSAAADFRRAEKFAACAGSEFLEATSLNRLGLALRAHGEDLAAAEESFVRASDLARGLDDLSLQASILNNLGMVDDIRGRPHRAVDRYEAALELWDRLAKPVDQVKTLQNLADVHARLGHHQQALYLLQDADEIAKRIRRPELEAGVLSSQGWVEHLRGRHRAAVEDLENALTFWRSINDYDRVGATLDRLGTVYAAAGDPSTALAKYRESLAVSEEDESPKDFASTMLNVGCLQKDLGRSGEALSTLDEARTHFHKIDDPKSLSQLEYCTAQAESLQDDLDAAADSIADALRHVDRLRDEARLRGERYRPIWLWQDYSDFEIELLMEKYRKTGERSFAEAAFEAGDLARARNFLDLMIESGELKQKVADSAILERFREIQKTLNSAQQERRRLLVERGATDGVQRQIAEATLSLERLRAEIRLSRGDAETLAPDPIALLDLQALLDPQTRLLSYVFGEQRSYLYVVGPASFDVWELAPEDFLNRHADALYRSLEKSRFGDYQHVLAARALAPLILPEGSIPEEAERLLILAADHLHYIPFAVLPSWKQDAAGRYDRLLGDDLEIVYSPSASILAALRRRDRNRRPPPKTIAVYADAVYSPEDDRTKPAESNLGGAGATSSTMRLPEGFLPRLPFTGQEAEAVLAMTSEDLRHRSLGFACSKQAVLRDDLDLYRIVHFATHAQVDEAFPELSGLVLSRLDRQGRPVDGNLYLHEIYGLRLASELVVLSGCQTALGKRVRGNGVVGLTRGFFYAGSSKVLVSLWSVDDEATSVLMEEFYRGVLIRGETPATALQRAQGVMRRQARWRAPYYWAAFVLQGDG